MKRIIENILTVLTSNEKKNLLRIMVANVMISIVDIISLALLLMVITFYTQPGFPARLSFLPPSLKDPGSIALIFVFCVFFTAKSIAGHFIYQAQYRFVYNVASRISSTNLLQYLEGNYSNYVNVDSSVHIRKISQQPIEFSQYVLSGVQQMITESILVLFTVIAILIFDVKLFLLLLMLLLPAVILLSYFVKRRLKSVREHVKKTSERSLQYLQEGLAGFIESNIYYKTDFFLNRYARYQQTLNRYLADLQVTQGMPSRFIEIFAVLGLLILITVNKLSGDPKTVNIIGIGAFIAAAYKIIPGIAKIFNISGQVKTYQFVLNDLALGKKNISWRSQAGFLNKMHSITFRQVSFSYNKNKILENFNLAFQSGDFIGISGSSGKGKTSVINLLLGFAEPDSGEILINDKVTDASARQQYWNNISYVKQQSFLINDTIKKNITLSEDRINEEKLNEAVRVSRLNELINKYPEGFDKVVTEQGKNISGGQRQRITIARAIYKDADCFILDEPFNELDEESEVALLSYFQLLVQNGKLVVLITHNKKSLSYCRKIISINEKE